MGCRIGAHTIQGAIKDKWLAGGGPTGLGFPTSDEMVTPDGIGRYNTFQRGSIYWSPTTDAHAVSGQILETWGEAGYEAGEYGYPTGDVGPGDRPGSTKQQFQTRSITYYGGGEHPAADEEEVFTRDHRGGNFVDDYGNLFTHVVFPDEIRPPYLPDQHPMDWNFVVNPAVQALAAANTMSCKADLIRGGSSFYHYSDLNKPVNYIFHSRMPKNLVNVRSTLEGKCTFRLGSLNGTGTVGFKLKYRILDPEE